MLKALDNKNDNRWLHVRHLRRVDVHGEAVLAVVGPADVGDAHTIDQTLHAGGAGLVRQQRARPRQRLLGRLVS